MIINQPGAGFEYEGITYIIGAPVIGTHAGEYEGLYGSITEIRDGEDKDTENETPDIYCSFEEPALPCEVKNWKRDFQNCMMSRRPLTILLWIWLSWHRK